MTVAALAVVMIASLSVNAQNKFKGIVKYTVSSTGEVAVQIPEQAATAEIKVMGDMLYTSSALFTNSPMVNSIIQRGNTTTTYQDLTMLLAYLASENVSLTSYSGDGKIFVRQTYTQEQIDSITIPVTEGYYIEYVAGQSQKIAGYNASLARIHMFDEEGADHTLDIWYTDEMGPAVNFLLNGVKGMPLQFTQDMGEGRAITVTATEVVKGKVKDVDFLAPSGYKEMDSETMKAFNEELMEELKALQED